MTDPLRRHKYAFNRILIPAARILSPEFNAVYLYFTGAHIELMRNLIDYANRETTFVDEYKEGYYISPDSADWDLIQLVVAELEEMLMTTVLGFYDAYVCVRDVKELGVDGGSFNVGAWRTRDINDEQSDAQGICSIDSNQITLGPGTYRVYITCPALGVKSHQARLYDETGAETLLWGGSSWLSQTQQSTERSILAGRITLTEESELEIQQQCEVTRANDGFGVAAEFGDEVYTIAEFWRET